MAENPGIFGVWKAYKSENMAALMEKGGAPWIARKAGANATPTVTINRLDSGGINISTKSLMSTMEENYVLGTLVANKFPFTGEMMDYEAEWDNSGRLVCYQGPQGSDIRRTGTKYIRSLEPNGDLLMTAVLDGVVAYRWFNRKN